MGCPITKFVWPHEPYLKLHDVVSYLTLGNHVLGNVHNEKSESRSLKDQPPRNYRTATHSATYSL
jgi:hypothetical protein